MDIPERRPAHADRSRHVAQTAFHQHHIRRVDGNIRTRADSNAHIRPCERRGVIDAIAHHGDFPLLFQGPDHAFLAFRENTCDHLVHTGLGADGFCRTLIVSGEHNDTDPHILQFFYRLRAVFLDHIRHGNDPGKLSVPAEEKRRLSLFGQCFRPPADLTGDIRPAADKRKIAAADRLAVYCTGKPVARKGLEIFHPGNRFCSCLSGFGHNSPGKRMFALLFQRAGRGQQFFPGHALCRDHIRHPGLPAGDGPGFIQGNDLRLPCLLQGNRCLEHNAVLCPHPVAYHDGHRSRKSQGAGAADHQHGNSSGQRKARRLACDQPYRDGHKGDPDHRRDEYAGYPVRHLGDGRFCSRRITHHLDDLGKRRVLAHPGRLAFQETGLIERRSRHPIPGVFIHRDALAGQGRFIDRADPFQHNAVHRYIFTGPYDEHIAFAHLINGDCLLDAVPHHRGCLRRQFHQTFQSVRGPAFGAGLQHLAHRDQGQDHGRRLKIKLMHIRHHARHIAPHLGVRHGKQGVQAVPVGRPGPKRHQGIHVRRPVDQSFKPADEELLVDHHDSGRQKELDQPHGHMVSFQE